MGSAISTYSNDQLLVNDRLIDDSNNYDNYDVRRTRRRLRQVRFHPDSLYNVEIIEGEKRRIYPNDNRDIRYYERSEEEGDSKWEHICDILANVDRNTEESWREEEEDPNWGIWTEDNLDDYPNAYDHSADDDDSFDGNDYDEQVVEEPSTPITNKKATTKKKLRRSHRIACLNPRRSARLAAKPRINYKE